MSDTAEPDDPESLAQRLATTLIARGEHLAVAEGATGGALANLLTSVPGSTRWFRAGVVANTTYPKQLLLRVSSDTVIDRGAISAEATAQMARMARRLFGTQWAIAVAGYADDTEPAEDIRAPGAPLSRSSGTAVGEDAPPAPRAGLTYLALATTGAAGEDEPPAWEERLLPALDRETYKREAAAAALEMLLAAIEERG